MVVGSYLLGRGCLCSILHVAPRMPPSERLLHEISLNSVPAGAHKRILEFDGDGGEGGKGGKGTASALC